MVMISEDFFRYMKYGHPTHRLYPGDADWYVSGTGALIYAPVGCSFLLALDMKVTR